MIMLLSGIRRSEHQVSKKIKDVVSKKIRDVMVCCYIKTLGKSLHNPLTFGGLSTSPPHLDAFKTGYLTPSTLQNRTNNPPSGFGRWFCYSNAFLSSSFIIYFR